MSCPVPILWPDIDRVSFGETRVLWGDACPLASRVSFGEGSPLRRSAGRAAARFPAAGPGKTVPRARLRLALAPSRAHAFEQSHTHGEVDSGSDSIVHQCCAPPLRVLALRWRRRGRPDRAGAEDTESGLRRGEAAGGGRKAGALVVVVRRARAAVRLGSRTGQMKHVKGT